MENIDPKIITAFFTGDVITEPIESGLINRTYKIKTQKGNFILQKINRKIFSDPEALQRNYEKIRNALITANSFLLPELIRTKSGEDFLKINDEAWRCFSFYDDSFSPSSIADIDQLKLLASSFGALTCALNHIPAKELSVILPQFHDLRFRFHQFIEALMNADEEKKKSVKELIAAVENDQQPLKLFDHIQAHPDIFPLHIMHHDCKISNILFHQSDNSIICPIDMDTTMPGFFFSDLGDMIRTLVADQKEDDPNYLEMKLSAQKLETLIAAYTEQVQDIFSPQELNMLVYSGHILSYMQCLRFLTDHLNGNIYYSTEYPEHNAVRAKNQWQLYSLLKAEIPFRHYNFSV